MKTGLVLEGGAMRGIYTAGVLDVFLDHGIEFDGVIGVSAGAIHGSNYIAGQNERIINYYLKYCDDKRFMSLYSLITTGSIVGEQFCYHDIPDYLNPLDYDSFRKSKTEFYMVCTDVEKGKPIYVKCKDLKGQLDFMRASASMPMVSKIVECGGRKLLDGAITDSIPLKAMQKLGYDRIVVVQTREKDYWKHSEWNIFADYLYRKYPGFLKAIRKRHLMYNSEKKYVEKSEQEGKIIALKPTRHVDIKRTEKNKDKITEMYLLGRFDAENKIDEIQKFLNA